MFWILKTFLSIAIKKTPVTIKVTGTCQIIIHHNTFQTQAIAALEQSTNCFIRVY